MQMQEINPTQTTTTTLITNHNHPELQQQRCTLYFSRSRARENFPEERRKEGQKWSLANSDSEPESDRREARSRPLSSVLLSSHKMRLRSASADSNASSPGSTSCRTARAGVESGAGSEVASRDSSGKQKPHEHDHVCCDRSDRCDRCGRCDRRHRCRYRRTHGGGGAGSKKVLGSTLGRPRPFLCGVIPVSCRFPLFLSLAPLTDQTDSSSEESHIPSTELFVQDCNEIFTFKDYLEQQRSPKPANSSSTKKTNSSCIPTNRGLQTGTRVRKTPGQPLRAGGSHSENSPPFSEARRNQHASSDIGREPICQKANKIGFGWRRRKLRNDMASVQAATKAHKELKMLINDRMDNPTLRARLPKRSKARRSRTTSGAWAGRQTLPPSLLQPLEDRSSKQEADMQTYISQVLDEAADLGRRRNAQNRRRRLLHQRHGLRHHPDGSRRSDFSRNSFGRSNQSSGLTGVLQDLLLSYKSFVEEVIKKNQPTKLRLEVLITKATCFRPTSEPKAYRFSRAAAVGSRFLPRSCSRSAQAFVQELSSDWLKGAQLKKILELSSRKVGICRPGSVEGEREKEEERRRERGRRMREREREREDRREKAERSRERKG
ncbi:hypothetical protein WMY93_016464 [Mugilogobius chulae]|uniref:Uncharacterized protein n=1 Tax=Mugilogobius chulae TaxID=88201 RepID=A0AAW0NWF3_9GOBI